MISIPLHAGWTLRSLRGPVPEHIAGVEIPAQVPGSVHTDLIRAQLINDPYVGMEESTLVWAHTTDWLYSTTFHAGAAQHGERLDLAFDGLDTVATIVLNGVEIGQTRNQHRGYRFDVTDLVTEGENTLSVEFDSALNYAWAEAERLGLRPRAYDHPFNMVRKMACSFGWDWGPDLQTAGIWKPARLERWSVVRAARTRTLVTVDVSGTGFAEVIMDLEWAPDAISDDSADISLDLAVGAAHGSQAAHASAVVAVGAEQASVRVEIPDAALWWPTGYGDHPLYDLAAVLSVGGAEADRYERRIGFRTVEVDTNPDEYGTPFVLKVNGKAVFVKGANWIPDDHLLTRITRAQLEDRADQALQSNMNLLRVWGGGIYETEDFYDVCDERGLMVWQDFLLACAAYPEEEPFLEEFTAEARENVARLTPHASLVIWNGGNENLWGFEDWGWQEELHGRTWGLKVYTEVFADAVAQLDPTRFYSDGSPYSPGFTKELATGTARVHPNDQAHGTRHEWEVWNRQDFLTHLEYVPRFCSEFGHQGPPTWSTLTRSVSELGRAKDTQEFLLHQKAESGNLKLDLGAAPHLPLPQEFEEWNWVTQLSQAHSVSFGIEHFRSFAPYCAGSIVWQINDCWPVTSWAAVDGDGREKPLFYALKHAYAPRLLTFKPRAEHTNGVGIGGVVGAGEGAVTQALGAAFGEDLPQGRAPLGTSTLFLHNDSDEAWDGDVRLSRQKFDGQILEESVVPVQVAARGVAQVALADGLLAPQDPSSELLVADLDGVRAFHYFVEYKELRLDPSPVSCEVRVIDGQARVRVTSSSLVVDLSILADRVHPDLVVDDQLVTLLAGESVEFVLEPRDQAGRKEGIGKLAAATTGPQEIVELFARVLEDDEAARRVVRSINTIKP